MCAAAVGRGAAAGSAAAASAAPGTAAGSAAAGTAAGSAAACAAGSAGAGGAAPAAAGSPPPSACSSCCCCSCGCGASPSSSSSSCSLARLRAPSVGGRAGSSGDDAPPSAAIALGSLTQQCQTPTPVRAVGARKQTSALGAEVTALAGGRAQLACRRRAVRKQLHPRALGAHRVPTCPPRDPPPRNARQRHPRPRPGYAHAIGGIKLAQRVHRCSWGAGGARYGERGRGAGGAASLAAGQRARGPLLLALAGGAGGGRARGAGTGGGTALLERQQVAGPCWRRRERLVCAPQGARVQHPPRWEACPAPQTSPVPPPVEQLDKLDTLAGLAVKYGVTVRGCTPRPPAARLRCPLAERPQLPMPPPSLPPWCCCCRWATSSAPTAFCQTRSCSRRTQCGYQKSRCPPLGARERLLGGGVGAVCAWPALRLPRRRPRPPHSGPVFSFG